MVVMMRVGNKTRPSRLNYLLTGLFRSLGVGRQEAGVGYMLLAQGGFQGIIVCIFFENNET